MNRIVKRLALLTVTKSTDYNNKVVNTLKEAGFTVIQEQDGLIEDRYVIGDKAESEVNNG